MGFPTKELAEREYAKRKAEAQAQDRYSDAACLGVGIGGSYQPVNSAVASREPTGELLQRDVAVNLELAGNLVARATMLADRIVGSQPQQDSAGQKLPFSGNGLLDSFRSSMAVQRQQLEAISEALSRMEREFG